MCVQSRARGKRTRGFLWVLGGLGGATWWLFRGSLCEERGHMASVRACGEGAAQMLGTHKESTCLSGCPHPVVCRGQFPEEGGSSLGQPGIVVICWS